MSLSRVVLISTLLDISSCFSNSGFTESKWAVKDLWKCSNSSIFPALCGDISTQLYSSRERITALNSVSTGRASLALKVFSIQPIIIIIFVDSTDPLLCSQKARPPDITSRSMTHLSRVMITPASFLYSAHNLISSLLPLKSRKFSLLSGIY